MSTNVDSARVSARTVRRLAPPLVAFGEFVDGYDLLVMGAALLFLKPDFHLSSSGAGWLGAISFIGAAVGLLIFGDLTDRYGRRVIFIINLLLFVVFSVVSAFAQNVPELMIARFLVGFGVGMDIPTSSAFLAEIAPGRRRGRLAGSLPNVMWLLGAVVAVGLAIVLRGTTGNDTWRWLFGLAAVPALLVLAGRQILPESPRWLSARGRHDEAAAIYRQLGIDEPERGGLEDGGPKRPGGYRALFAREHRTRVLVFALLFAANGFGGAVGTIAGPQVFSSTGLSQGLSLQFSLFGFLVGLVGVLGGSLLIDRVSRRWFGVIASLAAFFGAFVLGAFGKGHPAVLITGYLVFTFATWIGPGTLAWVWQGELFPTGLRGVGIGFTQAATRLAIAANAFLVPQMLTAHGLAAIIPFSFAYLIVIALLLSFRFFETTGLDLERASAADASIADAAGTSAALA